MGLLAQIAIGILVAGGIGLGVWSHKHRDVADRPRDTQNNVQVQADATLSAGSTNADLDKDLKTIDGELNIISQSSTDIDSSFNEQSMIESQ